jgi:hypothetical protein
MIAMIGLSLVIPLTFERRLPGLQTLFSRWGATETPRHRDGKKQFFFFSVALCLCGVFLWPKSAPLRFAAKQDLNLLTTIMSGSN